MKKLKSYEEFEKEFKENEPKLNKVEQLKRNRIIKILNQRVNETYKYGEIFVKRELALMDLHMEEILIIEKLSESGLIHEKSTNVVYESYKRRCEDGGIKPMNQIAFSRFVVKYFDYSIKNKKIKGKKYRIFMSTLEDRESKKINKATEDWWKL